MRNCIKCIFKIKPNETSVLIRVDDIIKHLNCDIKSCISSNFFFFKSLLRWLEHIMFVKKNSPSFSNILVNEERMEKGQ